MGKIADRKGCPKDLKPVLLSATRQVQTETGRTVESLIQYEIEKIRELCGPMYSGIPLDDIRRWATNLRKQGLVGSVNGVGPSKARPVNKEYEAYLLSQHWLEFSEKVREFWGHRCALCDSATSSIECHHRTYARVGNERITDCVALCHLCHKHTHKRIDKINSRATPLFGEGDDTNQS